MTAKSGVQRKKVLIKLELGAQKRFGLRDKGKGMGTLLFKERGRRRGRDSRGIRNGKKEKGETNTWGKKQKEEIGDNRGNQGKRKKMRGKGQS